MLAGAGDRLYGSVTPADIADEIWRARKIRVDRRKVQLDEPIRRLGTYQVDIEVFPEVVATVKTMVVPAEGSTFDLPVARRLIAGLIVRVRVLAAKSGYALRAARLDARRHG